MAKSKRLIKEEQKYQNLQERYEEMNEYLLDLIDEHNQAKEDLRYMRDFIHYQKLDNDYCHFRKYAHEDENSELPFPRLVL